MLFNIETFVSCNGSFQAGNSFTANWQADSETINFTISARTMGWVGIGFSEDELMVLN